MDLSLGPRLQLGVSSCLVGEAVRYDGTDRRDHWIADRFGPMVEWVRVCPEAEAGLGVPRPKIQLESHSGSMRVREVDAPADHTDRLHAWADARLSDLDDLDGFVLKARSPSCGVDGVTVFGEAAVGTQAPGFFAARLLEIDPLLPTCTEDDVQVPESRRHFLERAQIRARWRARPPGDDARRTLLARHDLLLVCREREPLDDDDGRELLARMHAAPTVAGHVDALARLFDRLDGVSGDERTGLGILIDQVQRGETDVEVARQLARGLVLRAGCHWSRTQHYLDPRP